ncbi:cytochrome P450 [Aspergillus spinulosporus]
MSPAGSLITVVLFWVVTRAIYNVFFHPLSRFPGPLLNRMTRMAYIIQVLKGTLHHDVLEMHQRYGDIEEMGKAPWFYRMYKHEPLSIINEDRERHSHLRRPMAHGFSEQSLRDQGPIIRGYVDLFCQRLREASASSKLVVLSDWLSYVAFDIVGDLSFGEPFGCLKEGKEDEWLKSMSNLGVTAIMFQILGFFPWIKHILFIFFYKKMRKYCDAHFKKSEEKLWRRIKIQGTRSDFIEGLLQKREQSTLSMEDLVANAQLFIGAGAETTATALKGLAYLILKHENVHEKLTKEIRSTFKDVDEITLSSVAQLSYLNACINEALRVYSPACNGLPRMVPKGGGYILGEYIPEKTTVAVHHWALYHRDKYFTDPDNFCPERFLGDPRFSKDQLKALQPFHVGPRNCLGRTLVYGEMRLVYALLLFNFDLKLADESQNWMEQRHWVMWEKPSLLVHLTPRETRSGQ